MRRKNCGPGGARGPLHPFPRSFYAPRHPLGLKMKSTPRPIRGSLQITDPFLLTQEEGPSSRRRDRLSEKGKTGSVMEPCPTTHIITAQHPRERDDEGSWMWAGEITIVTSTFQKVGLGTVPSTCCSPFTIFIFRIPSPAPVGLEDFLPQSPHRSAGRARSAATVTCGKHVFICPTLALSWMARVCLGRPCHAYTGY
jgi:hypothetical protein